MVGLRRQRSLEFLEGGFRFELHGDGVERRAVVGGEHGVRIRQQLRFARVAVAREGADDAPFVVGELHRAADVEIRVTILRGAADDQLAHAGLERTAFDQLDFRPQGKGRAARRRGTSRCPARRPFAGCGPRRAFPRKRSACRPRPGERPARRSRRSFRRAACCFRLPPSSHCAARARDPACRCSIACV